MRRSAARFFTFFLAMLVAQVSHAQDGTRGAVSLSVVEKGKARNIELYSHSFALVIGIDKYNDPAWPRLSNAINDAQAIKEELEKRGFEVQLETNLESVQLKKVIENFIYEKGRFKQARLFIWYAGHGHTIKGGRDRTRPNDEGYLVPSDAPSPDKDVWKFQQKALSLRRFGEYMREARAKHVMTVFDSCFSGVVFNSTRDRVPAIISHATTKRVRQFVSSGEAEQKVSDNGLFRELFLDAITGTDARADMNGDGYVIGSELGLYLKQRVTALTGNGQTPRSGKLNARGYDLGDFVFKVNGKTDTPPKKIRPPRLTDSNSDWREKQIWALTRESKDPRKYRMFVKQFPDSALASWALHKASELEALRKAREKKKREGEKQVAVGVFQKKQPDERNRFAPGTIFDDCNGASWCPSMVVVPKGSFMMGSPSGEKYQGNDEGPRHLVTMPRAFAVGKFEVTFAEWDACVSAGGCNGYRPGDKDWGRGKRPVIKVSWHDARAYVKWLSRKTGENYRLLTESEWEYAARVGRDTPFWWGSGITTDQANYDGNYTYNGPKGENRNKTVTVDSFKPNDFGLYNVHGNVREWVQDCHKSYGGAPSNGSPVSGSSGCRRVLRGGAWNDRVRYLRSASRNHAPPGVRSECCGFRVARTLGP